MAWVRIAEVTCTGDTDSEGTVVCKSGVASFARGTAPACNPLRADDAPLRVHQDSSEVCAERDATGQDKAQEGIPVEGVRVSPYDREHSPLTCNLGDGPGEIQPATNAIPTSGRRGMRRNFARRRPLTKDAIPRKARNIGQVHLHTSVVKPPK